jgi:predicted nicotinamide N-methyase
MAPRLSLSRGYETKDERIAIAGSGDLIIRSLLDRQQYSDPRGEAERRGISSALWPLFGVAWPSGLKLAMRMAARIMQAGERVLEIGCGLALGSLIAHRRGANVTASDCHPLAAGFLKVNLRLNGLGPMKYRHGHWGSGESSPLARNGNMRLRPVAGRFDLIIGSDVLYERDTLGELPRFLARHVVDQGEIWIVDPDRGNRAEFTRRMKQAGFACVEERLDSVATGIAHAYKGRLLAYRRA